MPQLEDFEALLKEVVNGKRLSASRMEKLTDIAMRNMDSDTQLVSILYRTHKSASSSAKIISSLYVFDALSRAARSHAQKRQLHIDMYAEKGNTARFLVKVGGILEGMIREVIATNLPEAKEKAKKILDIWTKADTFPAELLSSLKEIACAEAGKTAAKDPEPLRQSMPTTDPRKQSNLTPPQIPTPPIQSMPPQPSAMPVPNTNISFPTPEAAQATLLALLAKAAGGSGTQSQIAVNAAVQISKHPYNSPEASTRLSTDPRNRAGPSTSPVAQTVSGAGQSHNTQSANVYAQRGADYGVDYRNDRAHNEDRRRGAFRGGRGGFNNAGSHDYRGYVKEPRYEGRERWDRTKPDQSGDRRRFASRSQSPEPQKRELALQGPQQSHDGQTRRMFSRETERNAGKDEFGRELRATSVDKDDETRNSGDFGYRNPQHDSSAQSPISPTPSSRSQTMLATPTSQGPHQRESIQKHGIKNFDITTFNPTDAECWKALGEAFEATNGYPPTQEDAQQFVAASMSMVVGMNMGIGTGGIQSISAQAYPSMGPSDWPEADHDARNNAQPDGGHSTE